MMMSSGCPTASLAEKPNIFSAPAFHNVMMFFGSATTIASPTT